MDRRGETRFDVTCRYRIEGGRPYHCARQQYAMHEKTSRPVWLKFCLDATTEWKNAIYVHGLLYDKRHVCRYTDLQQQERTNTLYHCAPSLQDVVGGDRGGFPPCSVYEAGDGTLAETLAHGRLKIDQQRSILRAVRLRPLAHPSLGHVCVLDCRSA